MRMVVFEGETKGEKGEEAERLEVKGRQCQFMPFCALGSYWKW